MPSKYYNRNFKPQHFYHVFNRGAYKNNVFKSFQDYNTFTEILTYYLKYPTGKYFSYKNYVQKPYMKVPNLHVDSIRLIAYCLMPNHFHFILKQMPNATNKTGISNLMRRVMITYSLFFQYKYKHTGALFQGKYKNVTVDSSEQLLHLSKYIHQNPSKLVKNLSEYSYSSLPAYLKQIKPLDWLHLEYVLKLTSSYSKFLSSSSKKSDSKLIEKITLE